MIHLDNNATTRPCDEAVAAALDAATDAWHNPSSPHRAGQQARAVVELARRDVARLVNLPPRSIVFTSGATESINLAVRGALAASSRRTILLSAVEHDAVRACAEDLRALDLADVRPIPADSRARIDPAAVESLLDDSTALVCVQWVSGDTGVIQPIERIAALCRERNVPLFCDATQRVGRLPTDLGAAGVDLACFSAHKMHALKGAAALAVRPGARIRPTQPGAQELERRAGTEAVPAIAAFGAAARAAARWLEDDDAADRQRALRDRLERAILDAVPDARVNAADASRIWCTTSLTLPIEAEPLVLALSEAGLCASAGPACASGALEPSRTLLAMGLSPEEARRTIRLAISRETTSEEIRAAIPILTRAIARCAQEQTA